MLYQQYLIILVGSTTTVNSSCSSHGISCYFWTTNNDIFHTFGTRGVKNGYNIFVTIGNLKIRHHLKLLR